MSLINYSVIIPVHNSARILYALSTKFNALRSNISHTFEVVFVNDCSVDNSWEIIKSIKSKAEFPVRGISLSKNLGQHAALWVGMQQAKGEFIITIDDDLQFSPNDIPKLIAIQQEKNADLVYGTPINRAHSKTRNIASKLALYALNLFVGTSTHGSPFRLFKKLLINNFTRVPKPIFIDGVLAPLCNRTMWVYVSHHKRYAGQSGHRLLVQGWWALRLILSYKILKGWNKNYIDYSSYITETI
jgi:undecaprenyl-phosphate 4-deoxy-4-formamido-L-arabinose transferase